MAYVLLKVKYDAGLVTPEFMAEKVYEAEGVEWVKIEDAD